MEFRRFKFYGSEEERVRFEEMIQNKKRIDREAIYAILKHLSINPEAEEILKMEFPNV